MTSPKVLEETPLTMSELKEQIEGIKKRDKELGFRASKMHEYLKQVDTLDTKKTKELVDAIEKIKVPRLKDIHIYKIVDLMPTSVDDLKVILQGYTISVNNDNCKKIVDTVKKFK